MNKLSVSTLPIASAFCSRMGKLALLVSAVAAFTASVKADSFNKYNYVADVIGNNDSDLVKASRTGFGTIQGVQSVGASGDRTTIYATLWDVPGSSSSSIVYRGERGQGTPGYATYSIGSASQVETEFSASSTALSPSVVGIFSDSNPFSSDFNPYLRNRNFRVIWSGIPYNSPVEVSYANISDGGTYNSLPSAQNVQTNVTDVGFRGFATPYNTQYPGISKVYLSLERLSDHLYWSGTQWSHLRVNLPASTKPVTSNSAGRVEWTKTGGLPTGSNLLSGQYRLRTMAIEGVQFQPSGAGTLNTITFTINGSSPPLDTTPPNYPQLTSPLPGSRVSSLFSLSGTCSDNLGGSGVKNVLVNIVYEGSTLGQAPNPIHWNWDTRTWQPLAAGSNSSSNYLISQVTNGTSWSAAYANYAAPTGAQLYNGYYLIRLFAQDNAGNTTVGTWRLAYGVDFGSTSSARSFGGKKTIPPTTPNVVSVSPSGSSS